MREELRLQTIQGEVFDVVEDLDIMFACRAEDGSKRCVPKSIVVKTWVVDPLA